MVRPTSSFPVDTHTVDFCIVGGGMAGVCAALAAARHGARVALMHDRPVLGGNASSECRVTVSGADRNGGIPYLRETGILEELRLENVARNPHKVHSLWDLILYEQLRFEPNVTLLLNCSCLDADLEDAHIKSVTGWQTSTQTYQRVEARIFADCSGDAVLAPLTGADHRRGREARSEYDESIAPEEADDRTMGMTCLFMAAPHDTPQPFTPPAWAHRFEREEDLPCGVDAHSFWEEGYWWIELGGEEDSIRDTEQLRDELLKITLGVWDHVKNHCVHRDKAANWSLTWLQFVPGKRESRRYVGAHVLTQNDIEAEGRFEDVVAYGGWSMDDHHPAGFRAVKLGAPATIFHPAPSPYGIPFRSLYSRNIDNLMFAGRDISATHAAMSSTRVMATGAIMGQAVGTAAAMAVRQGGRPRDVCAHMPALQQALLADDCYLPGVAYAHSAITRQAALEASQGDPEPVRDGFARQIGDDVHAWTARPGDTLTYRFTAPTAVSEAEFVLDSAMEKMIALSWIPRSECCAVPAVMPKAFRLDAQQGGAWEIVARVAGNYQRHVRIPVRRTVEALRFTLEETWGATESRVYRFALT